MVPAKRLLYAVLHRCVGAVCLAVVWALAECVVGCVRLGRWLSGQERL